MYYKLVITLSMSATFCVVDHLTAAQIYESQMIVPDATGYSVGGFACDGATLLVRTRKPHSNAEEAIRVFQLNAENRFAEASAIPGTRWDEDNFGSSMSVLGDFALIGANAYDLGDGKDVGAAYFYRRSSGGWTGGKISTGKSTYDHLGLAVDLDTRSMIIGAPGQMDPRNGNYGQGVAYVRYNDTDWNGNGSGAQLEPSGPRHWSFGASVAISGDTAVVGAPGDGYEVPGAWVFQRNSAGQWRQVALLKSDSDNGRFGAAVDVRGGLIVVGDPNENIDGWADGAVYVYRRNGESDWVREAKLALPNAGSREKFGSSLSIGDEGSILVGIPGYYRHYNDVGAAALFTFDAQDAWKQSLMLIPAKGYQGSNFGYKVALCNDMAVISADTEFGYLRPTGAAYIYHLVPEPAGSTLFIVGASALVALAHRRSFS